MPAENASRDAVTVLCHCHLLRQAARRATALYDAALAPFGLRISQYGILVRLRRLGPLSLQQLAAELVLDRTTMGRNLRPLERDGLIASEPDPADKRVRRLVLTPAGLDLVQRAYPSWTGAQSDYEAQVGAEPAMALRIELQRVMTALQKAPMDPAID